MIRFRYLLVVGMIGALIGAFWCGRLTTPEPVNPSVPHVTLTRELGVPPYSGIRIKQLRSITAAEQQHIAAQLTEWLETNQRERVDDPRNLNYDSIAVFHAIKYIGEVRYTPAIPLLIREAVEHKLWIVNPDVNAENSRADVLEEYCIYTALAQIGIPSVSPLIDQYLLIWSWPIGQSRQAHLDGFSRLLSDDALVGVALRIINDRLSKANFIPGPREEIDALWHLKRELAKAIE